MRQIDRDLFSAVLDGDLYAAEEAVKAGADVNAKAVRTGITPLIVAASGFSFPMVRFLVEEGADIDAEDYSGNTPLSQANYSLAIREYLGSKGAEYGRLALDTGPHP